MDIEAQDFYALLCAKKFKHITSILQDGLSGIYLVLKILSESSSPLSAGDISVSLGVSTARTAVALTTLQKKGYIKKFKPGLDARKTMVELTPAGIDAFEKRKKELFLIIDKSLSWLDDSEKCCFYDIVKKLLSD